MQTKWQRCADDDGKEKWKDMQHQNENGRADKNEQPTDKQKAPNKARCTSPHATKYFVQGRKLDWERSDGRHSMMH